jgi:hypothetical protein
MNNEQYFLDSLDLMLGSLNVDNDEKVAQEVAEEFYFSELTEF